MSKFYSATKQRVMVCKKRGWAYDKGEETDMVPRSTLPLVLARLWELCERFLDFHGNFHLYLFCSS